MNKSKWFSYIRDNIIFNEIMFSIDVWMNKRYHKKERKRYKVRTVGEVIRYQKEERTDWLGMFFDAYGVYRKTVYSPIIRYEVDGEIYEIDGYDYYDYKPIIGRKALVVRSEYNAWQAALWTKRKYKGRLNVRKRDEKYVYCFCGIRKNIKLPIELVDEKAFPGCYLIEKYGYYHLEQPEDRAKSELQDMAEDTIFYKG